MVFYFFFAESLDPQVACQATFFPTLTRLLSPLPMSLGLVLLPPRLPRSSTRWPPTLNWAMNNPKIRPHAANHSNHQVIHVLIIDGAFFAPHNNNKLQWILWLENWSVVLEWLFRKKNLYDPPLGFLLAATLPLCGKTKDEKKRRRKSTCYCLISFFSLHLFMICTIQNKKSNKMQYLCLFKKAKETFIESLLLRQYMLKSRTTKL